MPGTKGFGFGVKWFGCFAWRDISCLHGMEVR
jgi:hypothetical protein